MNPKISHKKLEKLTMK